MIRKLVRMWPTALHWPAGDLGARDPLGGPGGEPGVVNGEPVAEAQVRRGEIAGQLLVAELVTGPGVRPDVTAMLVLDLRAQARRFPAGRPDGAPDAAGIVTDRLGLPDLLEPVRRVLLEHGDAVVAQMMPHRG